MKIILPKNLIHEKKYHEEDAIQAVVNYVNYLIDNYYIFDEVPELCKEIYYVDYYICETENGGLAQFVWNSKWSTEVRGFIRKGLKTVKANKHLAFFEKFESEIEALKNELTDFLGSDFWDADVVKAKINEKVLKFSNQSRSIYSVNNWFDDMALTQLGGFPSWIQDSIYPKCIECNEPMQFLGQVSNDDISLSEGIYYAHICTDCKVTCVHYQQT